MELVMKLLKCFVANLIFLSMMNNTFAVDESITVTATLPAWAVITPSTTTARIVLDGSPGAAEYNASLLTLNLSHNSSIGYSIKLKSMNNGVLVGNRNGSQVIPYKISYDGQPPIELTNNPTDIGGVDTVNSGIAITPVTKNMDIIVTNSNANAVSEQDYTDTITFTLTGN